MSALRTVSQSLAELLHSLWNACPSRDPIWTLNHQEARSFQVLANLLQSRLLQPDDPTPCCPHSRLIQGSPRPRRPPHVEDTGQELDLAEVVK